MLIPMQINGNYSYEVKNHYGANYCMIGDARGFIDPIFSSGVFLSIKAAHLVFPAIQKHLREPMAGENSLMVDAFEHITGAYNFVHRMIKMFYNPHAITWAEAGSDGQMHKRAESAMAAGHYMLSGDFFENYKKYDGFFQILESPDDFKRYKSLVLDRPNLNQPTCETPFDVVFAQMLEADEKRKAGIYPV